MRAVDTRILGWTLLVIAGCGEPAGPQPGLEQLGVLQLAAYEWPITVVADESVRWSVTPGSDVLAPPRVIIAPDSVDAGVAFDVTVTTIGLSGCWAAAGEWVGQGDGVLEIIPTDVHSGAEVCTDMLSYLAHPSRVRLDTPGEWTIRVKGRRLRHGDEVWEELVTAERRIVVR